MQLELYNALKAKIETLTSLKKVGLWNNQFAMEKENVSFDFPCCFIEFSNTNYSELMGGVQRYDMEVLLHLGFESYKTEDTQVLQLKQDLQATIHYFQQGYHTKMLRRSETQNFDHDNIQEFIIGYAVSGKDLSVSIMPTTDATVDTLIVTGLLVIDNNTINTGVIPEDNFISSESDYVTVSEGGHQIIIE